MQGMRSAVRGSSWLIVAAGISLAAPSTAQNAQFQTFFASVCPTATGTLLTRCQQTPGGLGDLSSDSESSLNPNQLAALNDAALSRAQSTARELQERLEGKREENPEAKLGASGWSAYFHGRGQFLDREPTTRERGFDADNYGFHLGADTRFGERGVAGLLFSYDRTDSEFDRDAAGLNFTPPNDDGTTDVNAYSLTAYGSLQLTPSLWAEGSLGYGYTDYELVRQAVFQESTRTVAQTDVSARADSEGHELMTSAALGFDQSLGAAELGGYARLNYSLSSVDGYRERDSSGLAMRVDGENQDSLTTVAGVRAGYALSAGFGVVVPQVRFEWEHEYLRDARGYDSSFVEDIARQVFTIRSGRPDRDTFNGGAGVLIVLPNGWIPFADYEGLIGHKYQSRHRVLVGVRKEL
jgi:outer membrane autotransporter protein